MLTAFGPFVTDMYLPSLPAMTSYFQTSTSMVQLGLTFSMLGLAIGQLLFGPLSDTFGRRKPLLVSMILFLFSTVACICAPTIEIFIALRFIQGAAGAGGIVISRSIATDKFKGASLAKALAVIGAINGIAPVTAPVIGGVVLKITGWQGIFAVLFVLGICLTAACIHFNESLSRARRSHEKITHTLNLFKNILGKRKYMFCVLQMAFAQAVLFGYIAASPFIIQQYYGFSPLAFSLFFAFNSLAIISGAGMSVKFKSQEKAILTGCAGMLLFSLLIGIALPAGISVWGFESLLFVLLLMLGVTFTASTTLAMENARENAGTASAFLGAVGFLFGSIVSPLVGMGNILLSSGMTFIVCSAASCAFGCLAVRSEPKGISSVQSHIG